MDGVTREYTGAMLRTTPTRAGRLRPSGSTTSASGPPNWGRSHRVANIELAGDEAHFRDWLVAGFQRRHGVHGRHGTKRSRPAELLPGTVSCISVRMDYGRTPAADATSVLEDGSVAYVSRYALGRDYHKLMRNRLQKLCDRIAGAVGAFGYRAFATAPRAREGARAQRRLGWIGKHTI